MGFEEITNSEFAEAYEAEHMQWLTGKQKEGNGFWEG